MGKYKKGESGNPKGRPPGRPNKVTATVRDTLELALRGELENIPELLKELEPRERIEAITKLLPYVSPKLQAAYVQEEGCRGITVIGMGYPEIDLSDFTDEELELIEKMGYAKQDF